MSDLLGELSEFCAIANRVIRQYYGAPDSCVFSTGVVCDVLRHYGLEAELLRVEAALFHDDRERYGCILGALPKGSRQSAATKDMWAGHLVSLVVGQYLVDTTLDQVNTKYPWLKARPLVIDLHATKWNEPDPPFGCPWTGCLRPWPELPVTVRFTRYPRQNGWKYAGDYQPCRRKQIVPKLIEAARGVFDREDWFDGF
jgi:hypothetical protein